MFLLNDNRIQLPKDNVFRRLSNTIAAVPETASGEISVNTLLTAAEIEAKRKAKKAPSSSG
jgi:hypothetical protein